MTQQDWLADVLRYAPNANGDAVAGIVRHCGIALRNRDSSMVSFSDPKELGRVRDRFLKKKLALDHSDGELDQAIAGVGNAMKADRTKNRVTVYYLLADHFDKLAMFVKPAAAPRAGKGAAASPAPAKAAAALDPSSDQSARLGADAGPAQTASPGFGSATSGSEPVRSERRFAAHDISVASPANAPAGEGGSRWWLWLLLILLLLALLYFILA